MALAAKAGVGGKGTTDKDGEGGGGLMPPADLRAALKKADTRGKPSSCVVGLTRDKQAVILVDHLPKPRKLLASVKAQGQAAGLDFDVPSLRFGRVAVSGKQVDILVNKAVAPALELKLRPVMRAAAHPAFTINADPAIEDEPEEPDAAAPNGHGGAPEGGNSPAPAPGQATGTSAPSGPSSGIPAASGPASGPPAGPDVAPPGKAALEQRLVALARQVTAAVRAGQPGADGLRTAAASAYAALRSGDLAAAGRGADDLERLLGAAGRTDAPGSPPTAATPAAPLPTPAVPAAPVSAAPSPPALSPAVLSPAAPAPNAGTGGAARAPSPLVALRDVAQGIPAAVAADPSRRQSLARLLADARAGAGTGDAAAAAPRIEALRQALAGGAVVAGGIAAAPAAGGLGLGGSATAARLGAAVFAAAPEVALVAGAAVLVAWMAKHGPVKSVPVAGFRAGTPGVAPLSAEVNGTRHSVMLYHGPAGSTPDLDNQHSIMLRVGDDGVLTDKAGRAVARLGEGEVVPLPGVDIPGLFHGDAATPPVSEQPMADEMPNGQRRDGTDWVDQPAPRPGTAAAPVPDLSGARVNLGSVALSPPPAGLAGNGGFTPAPPLPPLPGFTPAPEAGGPSAVSTPIPDGPLTSSSTGNTDEPRVNLGRWQETFPAMQPRRPEIFASEFGSEPPAIGKEQALADVRAEIKQAGATVSSSPEDVAYLDSREKALRPSAWKHDGRDIGRHHHRQA